MCFFKLTHNKDTCTGIKESTVQSDIVILLSNFLSMVDVHVAYLIFFVCACVTRGIFSSSSSSVVLNFCNEAFSSSSVPYILLSEVLICNSLLQLRVTLPYIDFQRLPHFVQKWLFLSSFPSIWETVLYI